METFFNSVVPEHAIHCDFEQGLIGSCASIKPNSYYDSPLDFGRPWDVSTGTGSYHGAAKAAKGVYYLNANTMSTSPTASITQKGSFSITPTAVAGKVKSLSYDFSDPNAAWNSILLLQKYRPLITIRKSFLVYLSTLEVLDPNLED